MNICLIIFFAHLAFCIWALFYDGAEHIATSRFLSNLLLPADATYKEVKFFVKMTAILIPFELFILPSLIQ